MGKKILAWMIPALMLGIAACGRSDPEPTFTVAGTGEAVNAFVAAQLVKQIPRKMTVAHRGDEVVATFALTGYRGEDVVELTKQALAHHLSYTVTGIAVRG